MSAGWWARLRARLGAAWPSMRARLLEDGGLRTVLVLVVAVSSGVRASSLVEAAAPVGALVCGMAALLVPPGAAGLGGSFLMARLAEQGTWRSLGLLVLGLGQGATAADMVDHAEAVALVVIGAVSAAKPAGGGR